MKKCKFSKMGTKTHQFKNRVKNPKKTKQIEKDKKRRMDEWRKWWS